MQIPPIRRNFAAAIVAILSALALAACMVTPGRFESTLDLRRDGHFSFAYAGEIHMLALSQLAGLMDKSERSFTPSDCWDDETFEERDCSEEELAQQEEDWNAAQEKRSQKDESEMQIMKAMLGGIDPSDPEAAKEFAARLQRQKGWKSVEYLGDGLFRVDFAIESELGHDFAFPTIERMPLPTPFVAANLRKEQTVRIDAPAFGPQNGTAPGSGMMSGLTPLMAIAMSEGGKARDDLKLPQIDGTFRIITDGEILANNTDEGPVSADGAQVLEWKVNARSENAPTALIRLAQ